MSTQNISWNIKLAPKTSITFPVAITRQLETPTKFASITSSHRKDYGVSRIIKMEPDDDNKFTAGLISHDPMVTTSLHLTETIE